MCAEGTVCKIPVVPCVNPDLHDEPHRQRGEQIGVSEKEIQGTDNMRDEESPLAAGRGLQGLRTL
jgi:hypothetical protein